MVRRIKSSFQLKKKELFFSQLFKECFSFTKNDMITSSELDKLFKKRKGVFKKKKEW